jgi:hypothetical protein
MATLLACDEELKGTLSTFVAEPRLAIAASELWRDEKIFADHCIPALQSALMSGALSQGIRGEIVAQILLLLACDSACNDAGLNSGSYISLRAVLSKLLPAETSVNLLENIPKHLMDSKIACCQFLHVAHGFTDKTFFELAERHCGASLREGQRGADLVIPILGPKGPGYLIIQVKNLISCQRDCAESKMVCCCLRPSYVFAAGNGMRADYLQALDKGSVCLFMQVGARTPSASAVEMPDRLPCALEIFGMEPRFLVSCIQHSNALKMLVHGKVDLEGYISKNDSVGPNPDAGGLRARRAWPFLIASHNEGAIQAPEVLHSNCGGEIMCLLAMFLTAVASHWQVIADAVEEKDIEIAGRTRHNPKGAGFAFP